MANVLFCPVTFNLAETTRMIQVARALAPQHHPVFMGYEDDFVSLIVDAGFEHRACTPSWSRAEREQAVAYDQGRAIRTPFTTELVAARVEVERRLIRQLNAPVVVTGSNLTSYLSARAEKVPLLYPVPFALTLAQVEQTSHMEFVRGSSRIARAADLIATSAFRWLYTRAPLAPRAFSKVAKANGVPPLKTVASLLTADRNLLTEMPWELAGYRIPEGFERVGPIFAHVDAPLPPIVEELAAASTPLVYLALGSSATRALALDAARALGTMPVNVIAPIRHYLEPNDAVPANVHVTDLLPAHKLGGLVDAAVIHGGQGTVQTACATGVPFVGMGLQPEQTWHVRACERRGNAVAISPRRVSKPEFVKAVQRVLTDPAIRTAAAEVCEAYALEDGAAVTARIIGAEIEQPGRFTR
ncbi:MAG: nucleotide disphospho-sugar-binding domain-containing protein [Microbacterium sp.]